MEEVVDIKSILFYIKHSSSNKWDPTNTFQMLEYLRDQKYYEKGLLYAVELGNELNFELQPDQIAEDFVIMRKKINELWPDPKNRPLFLGPDFIDVFDEYYHPVLETGTVDMLTYHNCIF